MMSSASGSEIFLFCTVLALNCIYLFRLPGFISAWREDERARRLLAPPDSANILHWSIATSVVIVRGICAFSFHGRDVPNLRSLARILGALLVPSLALFALLLSLFFLLR